MFFIGVFAIIFDQNQRVLLCHRRDMDVWNLPGGVLEAAELPTDAIVRETWEETGLIVSVEHLIGIYSKTDKNELVFAFICKVVGGELTPTDESDENRDFSLDEMPLNTLPKHVERIWDALQFKGQPIFKVQSGPAAREWLESI